MPYCAVSVSYNNIIHATNWMYMYNMVARTLLTNISVHVNTMATGWFENIRDRIGVASTILSAFVVGVNKMS